MRISTNAIVLNIIFDWLLVGGPTPWAHQLPFNFGAAGLVLATSVVNIYSCWALLIKLNSKIGEVPLRDWLLDILKLLFAGSVSGLISFTTKQFMFYPSNTWGQVIVISFASTICFLSFLLIVRFLGFKTLERSLTRGLKRLF